MIEEFYTDNEPGIKTGKGFRLLAVDGSRITLPLTKDLKAYFGETKNHTTTSIVQARCFVLYDLENNYIIDGELAPISQGDLILYDRGYPSYDFIKYHITNNSDYVIRVKISFSKLILDFEKSKKKSQIVTITSGRHVKLSDKASDKTAPIKVRFIRVELPVCLQPDEFTIHFHDFAAQNGELQKDESVTAAIGEYNNKYLTQFVYLPIKLRK